MKKILTWIADRPLVGALSVIVFVAMPPALLVSWVLEKHKHMVSLLYVYILAATTGVLIGLLAGMAFKWMWKYETPPENPHPYHTMD